MFTINLNVLMLAAICASGVLFATPASAQATRTWISGDGDDLNPCSRTAPCKTFQGAISKTAAGGEINCLDPGGFGGVTITKSISLICDNTQSGILVAATNAIIVNGAGVVVQISGLDFEGLGQTGSPGINAVTFLNGSVLIVRNSKMRGFRNGYGVSFTPQSNARLFVDNVIISESGIASNPATGGILVSPASGSTARATITNTQVLDTLNVGLRVDTAAGGVSTAAYATVKNSVFTNDGVGILVKAPVGAGPAHLLLSNSVVSDNSFGIIANGASTVGRVGGTTISGNDTALTTLSGASLYSYGDNLLDDNTTNSPFTLPAIVKH